MYNTEQEANSYEHDCCPIYTSKSVCKLKSMLRKLIQTTKSIIGDPDLLLESPFASEELEQLLKVGALPSFRYYFLLGLSAAIAALGLIANSSATIIGAMIIAPLMNPIVSLSYAMIKSKYKLFARATLTLSTGVFEVILISFLITQLLGTRITGSEILARSNPNLIDLGVAMASGVAGAFALTRRSISNTLPGVAIAVALVPPLCVVGIGLALGSGQITDPQYSIANEVLVIENGSFLLFMTNFIAIVFCGGLVFLCQRYSNWKQSYISLTIFLLLLITISLPLRSSFKNFVVRSIILENLDELRYENPQLYNKNVQVRQIHIYPDKNPTLVLFELVAPSGAISATDIEILEQDLALKSNRPLDIKVQLFEFKTLNN